MYLCNGTSTHFTHIVKQKPERKKQKVNIAVCLYEKREGAQDNLEEKYICCDKTENIEF